MMKGENGWLLQQQEQRYTLLSHCYYLLPTHCQLFHGAEEFPELKGGVIGGEYYERGEWVAVAVRWGVTKYLHLDQMDDGTDGWMEKASQRQRPLHRVTSVNLVPNAHVCYVNNVWFMFQFFFLTFIFFIFYFYVFSVIIIIFYNKIKCFFFTFVFLFIWMQV